MRPSGSRPGPETSFEGRPPTCPRRPKGGKLEGETSEGKGMSIARINDPRAFRDFLDATLSDGGPDLTLDDALGLWEQENQTEDERAETHRAIRQGLADIEAGRVRPFEEFDREFREERGYPSRR